MRRELILLLVFSFALVGCAQEKEPLLAATQNGDVSAMKALLDQGGDANLKDETSRTLLMYATVKNHQEIVQLLLDKGADVNARNNNGETALTLAAREGHPEIARALLAKGADVNVEDNSGWAPVVYATQFNHPATLKVLLEEGRANVTGKQGQKALGVGKEHPDLLELLQKAGARDEIGR